MGLLNPSVSPERLGAQLGTRLAVMMNRSRVAVESQLAPARVDERLRTQVLEAEQAARAVRGQVEAWLESLTPHSPLPAPLANLFGGLVNFLSFVAREAIGTAIGFGVGSALGAVLEPLFRTLEQDVNRQFTNQVLTPPVLAELVRRGLRREDDAASEAQMSGLAPQRFRELVALQRALLNLDLIFEAVRRSLITRDEARRKLRELGFDDVDIDLMLEPPQGRDPRGLANIQIPLSDIVTMASREVFEPDQRELLGLDEEFPPELAEAAARLGIPESVARDIWAMHWDVPGLSQMFEMFHRGVIDERGLLSAFRTAEVPPFWRDKLLAISYNPLPRVDIRRMHAVGLLDEGQLVRRYRDIGFSPQDAALMAEFTIRFNQPEERQASKAEIVDLYENRALTRAEAEAMLRDIGMPNSVVGLVLDLADLRNSKRAQNLATQRVRSQYVRFRLSLQEADAALDRLRVPPDEKEELLNIWTLEREISEAELSVAQLQRFARKGIISRQRLEQELRQRGYSEEEVGWLVADAGIEEGAA